MQKKNEKILNLRFFVTLTGEEIKGTQFGHELDPVIPFTLHKV